MSHGNLKNIKDLCKKDESNYDINLCVLVDGNTYVLSLEISPGTQPPGPCLRSNKSSDIVNRLLVSISQPNQNVTFDNWLLVSN